MPVVKRRQRHRTSAAPGSGCPRPARLVEPVLSNKPSTPRRQNRKIRACQSAASRFGEYSVCYVSGCKSDGAFLRFALGPRSLAPPSAAITLRLNVWTFVVRSWAARELSSGWMPLLLTLHPPTFPHGSLMVAVRPCPLLSARMPIGVLFPLAVDVDHLAPH